MLELGSRERSPMKRMTLSTVVWVGTVLSAVTSSRADDWPMFGGTPSRNMASAERSQPPTDWDVRSGRNVKWSAPLGSQSYGPPVVAGGVVYVGTNNEGKRDPAHDKDGGVLMAFD